MTDTTIAAMTSTGKDDWETPPWLFDKLNAEFHFTLDPCCTHQTAKCCKHYTPAENGLAQDWGAKSFFAIRLTLARQRPIPDKSRGCRNAQRRHKIQTRSLWHCCPRERIPNSFTDTYTGEPKFASLKAACLSSTAEMKQENRFLVL